jgi:S1-C subfamily serine protease
VIISIQGQRVGSPLILRRILLGATGRVPVVILRDGTEQTIYLEDLQLQTRSRAPYGYEDEFYQADRAWLGVFFDSRYDNVVVVQAVQEGSAAEDAGIRAGDRIMSINGRRVQTPSQLSQMIGSMEPGDRVEIDVARWQTRQVEAQLGERPATSSRFRYLEEGNVPQANRTEGGNFDRAPDDRRETFRVQP